jgi:hypothetical protein
LPKAALSLATLAANAAAPRQNLRPVARGAGIDLDHDAVRLHAEEAEGFERMPVGVARLIVRRPRRVVDGGLQRRFHILSESGHGRE